jgi:prolyl oligopeptidase
MRMPLTLFACGLIAAGTIALTTMSQADTNTNRPPQTKRGDVVDDYHGTKVSDPYRWLEETESSETQGWIKAQNKYTADFLKRVPGRDRIQKRLTQLWDYAKFGMPSKEGGKYFYTKNDGLQNQAVLYVADSLDAEPRVLLDPNKLSKDGTVALAGTAVSHDAKYLAYSTQSGGSDWQTWHVREVATGKDLTDKIEWAKFSGASWSKDGRGFYYSRYDAPKSNEALKQANYFHKIYYHALGTPQDKDVLVYDRPDQKDWNLNAGVTDDGKYLIIYANRGTDRKNRIFYKDLTDPNAKVLPVFDQADARYSVLGNDGATFYVQTDKDAPRGKVISLNIAKPSEWTELIPQAAETLQSTDVTGRHLLATYLKDAKTLVKVYDLSGKWVRDVDLPGIGTAGGFGGKLDDAETFYSFVSFTAPPAIYRYDVNSGKSTLFRRAEVAFNPDDYETKQIFYASKDGTQVPMFLTYKKGLKLDGTNPTYLYGYGGFNSAMTPFFSVGMQVWMEMGGVLAVASIRGGGEYGKEWYEAGTKLKKQNVFDDFIAGAEWLIANKYTSSPKLAIAGGSNGGLLVGACITQRPDLFGAALPAVGVLDMLRFHKFTIGWAWTSDYGSPDNADEFKALYAYSPYHRVQSGTSYPATLITTGDHDDRVFPAHSFKFAAALQNAQAGTAPVLIRVETRAGHGAGKPTTKQIEEVTDRWAFLSRVLDVPVPDKFGN